MLSDDFSSRKEKTDYLTLDALKSLEINDTSHFIGVEHPIDCCFQELDSDVSSNFSLDVVSTTGVQNRVSKKMMGSDLRLRLNGW